MCKLLSCIYMPWNFYLQEVFDDDSYSVGSSSSYLSQVHIVIIATIGILNISIINVLALSSAQEF